MAGTSWGAVSLKMPELIEVSNLVNEKVCKPIGEETLAEAQALAEEFAVTGNYKNTLRLETDVRTGADDWAHTRVVSGAAYGMQVEARHGTLARALGDS